MTSTLVPQSFTISPRPRQASAEIMRFRDFVEPRDTATPSQSARLVDADGRSIDVPPELFDVLRLAAQNLAEGRAITLAPLDTQLTSQEAAELLGMSRPTLNKLLDAGEIPCTKVGRHRRVRLSALLEYRERADDVREEALRDMAEVAREAGMYESTAYSAEGIR